MVDSINVHFPDLNLEPDWNSIKPILTSALTAIKSSIGTQTDAQAADALAQSIIRILDLAATKAVESAIFYLQDIPADHASQVISAWINTWLFWLNRKLSRFWKGNLMNLQSYLALRILPTRLQPGFIIKFWTSSVPKIYMTLFTLCWKNSVILILKQPLLK